MLHPVSQIDACLEAVLNALATRPVGLVSDVDGTLSPIVEDPDSATVSDEIVRSLRHLASRLDLVALLSGRRVSDLHRMVDAPGIILVGVHGLESRDGANVRFHPEAAPFAHQLSEAEAWLHAQGLPAGVITENKGVALAIHYRKAHDTSAARERLLTMLADNPAARGLRLTEGRMLLELLPPLLVDKGTAVRHIVESSALASCVYFGDDTTDLDAFRELTALRERSLRDAVTVVVANDEAAPEVIDAADFVLSSVYEVGVLLDSLASSLKSRAV